MMVVHGAEALSALSEASIIEYAGALPFYVLWLRLCTGSIGTIHSLTHECQQDICGQIEVLDHILLKQVTQKKGEPPLLGTSRTCI